MKVNIFVLFLFHRFEINFQTGQSDSDDIAFHFNPRIGQYVSLNSFINGSWEKEERISDGLFTKEAAFYMFVVIGLEGYEVCLFFVHKLIIKTK